MISLDFGLGGIEAEFWRWMFVMTRLGAAMLAAPIFGASSVPPQVRVIAAGALGIFLCVWFPAVQAPQDLLSVEGMVIVAGEVLIGLSMGFLLQMAFAAPVLAAEVISGTMGMSMATAVDPGSGSQSPALGQYFTVVMTLIFLALGAHLLWIRLLVESYMTFPPGGTWFGPERLEILLSFATTMFVTAVVIALPVTFVLLLTQVVTGVLSRSAPSLNLFALGLPAGVLAGLVALIASLPVLHEQLGDLSMAAISASEALVIR
ncbi:flagellar biosynthetic protein FliR [Croceicoccus gelatinilyticus]|uniref:flagellar biosynthetic protein FliR n=1 Tax=Croceicoccus gelatinilyticus TaxID=2835536 RepID=UPI001BD09185|nr:flagellar biosynthetic protein FliR [Croceicoccus gelatinilyticus]MBS7671342.1 flagellar biosynthetic protein FliR [Croceicoccus gelatinilyticus]